MDFEAPDRVTTPEPDNTPLALTVRSPVIVTLEPLSLRVLFAFIVKSPVTVYVEPVIVELSDMYALFEPTLRLGYRLMAAEPESALRDAPWLISPRARMVIVELLVTAPVIDTLAGDVPVATPTSTAFVVPSDASSPAKVNAVVELAVK